MRGSAAAMVKRLFVWYARRRRDLPWRAPRPDPYHVLVSETMLQQTQVKTVIPYFQRFIRRFPTIRDLAASDERQILRLWQGLGYYSRGRNLLKAAQVVVDQFDGRIPSSPDDLLSLPGVGRYTAGAVASLAFGEPSAVVDGNVARVLCRLDLIRDDPRGKTTVQHLWRRAEGLVPKRDPGGFNSAMMELGALVCRARSPLCPQCPLRMHCDAHAAGMQDAIPPPRSRPKLPLLRRQTLCIRRPNRGGDSWLIEQRPATGRWAGMWQFVTRPATRERGTRLPAGSRKIATLSHVLSHRRYVFDVYVCDARNGCDGTSANPSNLTRRWVRLPALDEFPLPRPHLRIAKILQDLPS